MKEHNIVVMGFGERGGAVIDGLIKEIAHCVTYKANPNEPDPFIKRTWTLQAKEALKRASIAIFVGGFHKEPYAALSVARTAKNAGVFVIALEVEPFNSAGYRCATRKAVDLWLSVDESRLPLMDGDSLARLVETIASVTSDRGLLAVGISDITESWKGIKDTKMGTGFVPGQIEGDASLAVGDGAKAAFLAIAEVMPRP